MYEVGGMELESEPVAIANFCVGDIRVLVRKAVGAEREKRRNIMESTRWESMGEILDHSCCTIVIESQWR